MNAEHKLSVEINYCSGCDVCRDLLDLSCLVFPEIFRLYEKKRASGEEVSTDKLRILVGLCNFSALCPCCDLREALLNAKTEYGEKFGLRFKTRLIENVDRIGRCGGTFPLLRNFFLQNEGTRGWIQWISGVHRAHKFPRFAKENFPKWYSS
jgi:glycerol-3-phosphate dehydrogenase subunit C